MKLMFNKWNSKKFNNKHSIFPKFRVLKKKNFETLNFKKSNLINFNSQKLIFERPKFNFKRLNFKKRN